VHIKNNECVYALPQQTIDVGSHQRNQVVELIGLFGKFHLHSVLISFFDLAEDILYGERPPDLSAGDGNLTQL
jgi:hypothetical protein